MASLKPNVVTFFFTAFFLGTAWSGSPPTVHCNKIEAGAIRWDAWHGDDSPVAQYVESSLGSRRWQDRWPFFFTNLAGDIDFDETLAGVVPAENALAHSAGLDYWAFVFHGRASPMGRVLDAYLADRSVKPKFALILTAARMSEPHDGNALLQEAVILTQEKNYLTDAAQRPVIFVMLTGGMEDKQWVLRQINAIELLKSKIKASGGPAPSIVVLAFNPGFAASVADQIGADQISSYASHGGKDGGSYQDLVQGVEEFWKKQASTGKSVVPVVMTGWDPRPRVEKPAPWDKSLTKIHYQPGTPEQIAMHARNAVQWVKNQSDNQCLILIYAWNEFDEGGWLAPTVGEGLSRLRALTNVLKVH